MSSTDSQGPTVRSGVEEGDRNTRKPYTGTKEGMWRITLAMNIKLFGNLEKAAPRACPHFLLVPAKILSH